jgi:Ser/Thr protein kinase RdoA (MazF antagonist)
MARGGWAAGGAGTLGSLFGMVTLPCWLTDIVYPDGDGRRGRVSTGFLALTPDRILEAVEVGGLRCTGRCLPLRAFENRVYEVELEDERRLVVKFYRPGRWSRETILDEHTLLADLAAAELPAVPPVDLGIGATLAEIDSIHYAAFPKVRGRTLSEADDERLRQIGRLIGRMHAVGAARAAPARPRLTVERFVHEPLAVLMSAKLISEALGSRYRDLALRIADAAGPQLTGARTQRIHGDLHWGNVIWGADGPILLDFDDCMTGPPVQDLWLLAPGPSEEACRARNQLLEGYELFREFDRTTLVLCEPLRALRIIYISAWIARRWDDASFRTGFPAFGTEHYWAREYEELFAIFESL